MLVFATVTATGIVLEFMYATTQQPPDLPIGVIIKFNDYRGPSLSDEMPGCVPHMPSHKNSRLIRWGPRETTLAWARTIYRSQQKLGLTLGTLRSETRRLPERGG